MDVGDTTAIGDYVFTFRGVQEVAGANYKAAQGTIEVVEGGKSVATLHPEKRIYTATQAVMTEAAIDVGIRRDLYVSLGEPIVDKSTNGSDRGAWIVRVYYKPFVDWIWGGCFIMAIGGLLAATDRRYRSRVRRAKTVDTTVNVPPHAEPATAT
jgi:cytochrome c-type biogenesis protein CcmF